MDENKCPVWYKNKKMSNGDWIEKRNIRFKGISPVRGIILYHNPQAILVFIFFIYLENFLNFIFYRTDENK